MATTALPIPSDSGRGVPEWFGRQSPGGEGASEPFPASMIMNSPTEGQRAVRVSSWTWGDGLKLCWPAPIPTERVYFPTGPVEGGYCLADIILEGEGWLIKAELHDVAVSPEHWVEVMYGHEWELDGWREKAGRLYLLISPSPGL